MRYGSVCSGVEAATVAWHDLGWEPAFFSEIEAFPRAVLEHHYPDVPVHGDFTTIKEKEYGSIDLLVGGTPCQSFSVAGLRGGMDDERGNLALEFVRLAQRERPQWLVWENVPGVLSSNGGRDFGSLLGALAHIGYGFAYRVLDAQFFGVAQRRRRVFLVGYLGDWRPPAAVLFERESLSGDPAPSREARKEAARNAGGCTEAGGRQWPADVACTLNAAFADKQGLEDQHALNGASLFVPDVVGTLTAGMSKGPRGTEAVQSNHILPVLASGQSNACLSDNISPTLNCNRDGSPIAFPSRSHMMSMGHDVAPAMLASRETAVAFDPYSFSFALGNDISPTMVSSNNPAAAYGLRSGNTSSNGIGVQEEATHTLNTNDRHAVAFAQNSRNEIREMSVLGTLGCGGGKPGQGYAAVRSDMQVRRLTPRECERLQGFPDDYTQIPYRNKAAEDCPKGPRYKAMGNSMAVPVMSWIGNRISKVSGILLEDNARVSHG